MAGWFRTARMSGSGVADVTLAFSNGSGMSFQLSWTRAMSHLIAFSTHPTINQFVLVHRSEGDDSLEIHFESEYPPVFFTSTPPNKEGALALEMIPIEDPTGPPMNFSDYLLQAGPGDDTGVEYLPLDGSKSMAGWLNFGVDQSGLVFYGAGRIYKRSGGGMILRKSSGNQQWCVQNNDGGGEVAIATLNDIPAPVPGPAGPQGIQGEPGPKGDKGDSGAGAAFTVGDIKAGFQLADHAGWIILNGRAVSTLTATQQTAAQSLGFAENIPDALYAIPLQNMRPMGEVSGSNQRILSQANLPAVTLTSDSAGDHQHGMQACTNDEGTVGLSEMFAEYPNKVWRRPATVANTNNQNLIMIGYPMEYAGPHSHTVALGGADEPLDITPKAYACNHFVYLGE